MRGQPALQRRASGCVRLKTSPTAVASRVLIGLAGQAPLPPGVAGPTGVAYLDIYGTLKQTYGCSRYA